VGVSNAVMAPVGVRFVDWSLGSRKAGASLTA
jgi:hypothetical protein